MHGFSAALLASILVACASALPQGDGTRSLLQAEAPAEAAPAPEAMPIAAGPQTLYSSVSSGVFVTCAIAQADAGAYCFGGNGDGAVGDGTQIDRLVPTRVAGDGAWSSVSGGDWHTCGTKTDGRGYCWGFNGGRLGLPQDDPVQATVPQQINGTWKEISAGHFHSCGIQTSGYAYCWGNNKNGRLGNGNITEAPGGDHVGDIGYVYKPVRVKGDNTWVSISAKGSHTCGLKRDGTAWCWGGNDNGDLGIGNATKYEASPQQVPGQWKAVTSGLRYSCGIDSKDDLYCWGALQGGGNASINTAERLSDTPGKIGGGHKWKSVSGGMQHVCGVLTDSTARCFGLGWHGQLGNGLLTDVTEPYAPSCLSKAPCPVAGNRTWIEVAAGEYNTCGVKTDGVMACWGENTYGQLGNGKVGDYIYEPLDALPAVGSAAPAPAPALVLVPVPAPVPAPALAPVPMEVPVAAPVPAAAPAPVDAAVLPVPIVTDTPAPVPAEPAVSAAGIPVAATAAWGLSLGLALLALQ